MTRFITSVTGNIPETDLGMIDAHNHMWISPVPSSGDGCPVLNDFENIRDEMSLYKAAGGSAIVDCQPAGCGRDANKLRELSESTGVAIIACTGFHRPVYYPPDYWLWSASSYRITEFFIQEIETGLQETMASNKPVKAGLIKIACEETLENTCQPALIAAAQAARLTECTLEIHTEKGKSALEIMRFFLDQGVLPSQIVLCHIDKRPDAGLHAELAAAGIALEYDTFFREKYHPHENVWPLISRLVANGYAGNVCLATDMAESVYWSTLGKGPGLTAFPTVIRQQLLDLGIDTPTVEKLTGRNIARILAREL